MKRKLTALFCAALMALTCCCGAAAEETGHRLTEGISPVNALIDIVICAQDEGMVPDYGTVVRDKNVSSIRCGIFLATVRGSGGTAYSATLSASYLDAEYALKFGKIFGRMLAVFGNFENIDNILTAIDWNAVNTLTANTQTLIEGEFRIIFKVDPEDEQHYQLTIELRDPPQVQEARSATEILIAMDLDLSGFIAYTEETDPNQMMGREGAYISKVNFGLRSIDPDAGNGTSIDVAQGGSIEMFADVNDAIERSRTILGNEANIFSDMHYNLVCGTALLRLSNRISPEEAGTVFAAFLRVMNNGEMPPVPGKDPGTEGAEEPGQDRLTEPDPAPEPAAVTVEAGDEVIFGSYEQDNDISNGKEPIRWTVLKVEDGRAMLLSVYALDVYNTEWKSPTWDNSTLRGWLNGAFLDEAFSAEEQESLAFATVKADRNPNYDSDPGTDTQDRVFCLSYPEADSLLTVAARKTEATAYARKSRNVYTEGNCCYWWLRSPGKSGCGAAIVCTDGSYDYDVSYDGFCYGVRPAVWVDAGAVTGGP